MQRALDHQHPALRRLDADKTKHRLVGQLRLVAADHDADSADAQASAGAEVHAEASVIGAGRFKAAIGQVFDQKISFKWRVSRGAGTSTQLQANDGALAGRV